MLNTSGQSTPISGARFQLFSIVAAFVALVLGSLAAPAMGQAEQAQPKKPSLEDYPKVVAVVNGSTISRDQLAKACMRRFGPVVVDNLLNKWLILQACEAKGIVISQEDVNADINKTAAKFGISTKLFLENLETERDITPEHYAAEIIWPMLALRALAADQIAVTDKEIDEIIQSEYGEKAQVRMISSKTKSKAEELHKMLTAEPERFARVATEQSEDAVSASVGGLLPPIRRFSGDDLLEKFAFQLKPNQISPVFEIGGQYIFLQGVRINPARMPAPQLLPKVKERIHDQLRDSRLGQAANDIFARLQADSKVTIIYGNPELEKKYPGVAALINSQGVSTDLLAYECVKRHGRQILRGEIDRVLLQQQLKAKQKVIIQPDIDAEIANFADRAGYINADGSPNTDAWLKSIVEEDRVSIDLYIDDAVWPSVAMKKLVEDEVTVTEEDLQKGFESNYGPRAEILAIVLSNQRTAQDVFQQARTNLSEENFGALAAEYSVEPVSRSNYGKIPAMRRHSGRPTLEEVAFSLKAGEMSGVIAWGDQYAILYKQGETKPLIQDFEIVRPELEKELRGKKMRIQMGKKLDAIKRASQIDNLLEGTVQSAVRPASATSPSRR